MPQDLGVHSDGNRLIMGDREMEFSSYAYNEKTKEVLIIEGVRENWTPAPVEIVKSHSGFIDQKKFKGIVTANAFMVENIPYHWKKGKLEIWKG